MPDPVPTPEEIRNGWTPAKLAAYRRDRDAVHGLVGGNLVTTVPRPKGWRPPITIENTTQFNPHTWGR